MERKTRIRWILQSPIGKLLAKGIADTKEEAKQQAWEKMESMGRKRGSVTYQTVYPTEENNG